MRYKSCADIDWCLALEPTPRIELGTSFLPRMRSTTELCGPDDSSHYEVHLLTNPYCNSGARDRIRTCEAVKRQIYSLLGLTTPQPLPKQKLYHSKTEFHYAWRRYSKGFFRTRNFEPDTSL